MTNDKSQYTPICKHEFAPRKVFTLMYAPFAVWPWCISYHGNGHYFQTVCETLSYAEGRGWVNFGERETIAKAVEKYIRGETTNEPPVPYVVFSDQETADSYGK